MRRFSCPQCGHEIHFSNTQCVQCSAKLGYDPGNDLMVVIPPNATGPIAGFPTHAICANRERISCNWLCDTRNDAKLCLSCLHTVKIPNLSKADSLKRWSRLERAKRRLFYSLIKFRLPLSRARDPAPGSLRFELIGDHVKPDGSKSRVMTGHDDGLITINIAEADDAIREANRTAMGEPYRTLLGHFRHEVGHYYWDKLVDQPGTIDDFRACFGDERADYSDSLKSYYDSGPPAGWNHSYVSAYATAHPWEDFAETWAHHFHMVAGLETAYSYGINPQPMQGGAAPLLQLVDPFHEGDHEQLTRHWQPITVAMNAMNRSMGNRDFYPFTLTPAITRKLRFVHDIVVEYSTVQRQISNASGAGGFLQSAT